MAAARDIESDKRDIADAAIVAIERAFRQANLTITVVSSIGGAGEKPLTALAPEALGRRAPQAYHSLPAVAYAWFVWLLTESIHRATAWTGIVNSDYAHVAGGVRHWRGYNPWPVNTPEEALGAEVFFVGKRALEAIDRFEGDNRAHPSGWGMIQHQADVLEAIRARLHWPRLPDDFVPAPPGQWPNHIAESASKCRNETCVLSLGHHGAHRGN